MAYSFFILSSIVISFHSDALISAGIHSISPCILFSHKSSAKLLYNHKYPNQKCTHTQSNLLNGKSCYITQKIIECSQILLPLLNRRILINASFHSLRLQKFIYGPVVQSKL